MTAAAAPSPRYRPWLFRFAVFTALSTLGLIGMGGLVTSHQAGMAVPDWPTTYGYNMFLFPMSDWVGGIFYEHSHRLWASGVGLLTTILAIWIALADHRRWLKWLGAVAFVLVCFQGILGGLRVVWHMDDLGIVHATLAQLFLFLVSAMALFLSRAWVEAREEARPPSEGPGSGPNDGEPSLAPLAIRRRWSALLGGLSVLILVQLILGASMRHQHAGLAVPDFPLAYGKVWPAMDEASLQVYNQSRMDTRGFGDVTAGQILLHMCHRLGALIIFVAAALLAWKARRRAAQPVAPWFRRAVWGWFALILGQAILGAATVWSDKAADVATLHVLLGAFCLAWGGLLALISRKFSIDGASELLHAPADFSSSAVLGQAQS